MSVDRSSSPPESGARPQGIFSWLAAGRRGFEAWTYVLHRLSGLALLLFLMAHVFFTASRLMGEEVWARMMAFSALPVVRFFEFLVFVAFAFHAFNGVRLILVELGFGIGKAEQPVYPFTGSVRKQRPLAIAMMLIAALLIALGGFELLRLPH